MVWNEPGGTRGKDPWGARGTGGGPPELDEVVRKLQEKLRGLFSGARREGGEGGGPGIWIIAVLVVAALLLWESAYIIEPPERGAVLRFGAYAAILEPGLNFRLPRPIEFVEVINIDQIRSVDHKATMLTQDENIVDVELAVQYRVKDAEDYLFNVLRPDATLAQATESAVRTIIGKSKMDFVLTEGRAEIAAGIRELIQQLLDRYQAGVQVTSVNMQPAKPPEEVKSAFDDAIKAREDEQRLINEGEAYRNEILPKSRGAAARLREEAIAYKARVIAAAEGETKRFEKLLVEYEKAPEITRRRLYLETMESVLSGTAKVLLDAKGGNNLVYLPLDKLIERKETTTPSLVAPLPTSPSLDTQQLTADRDLRDRAESRTRGAR